MTWYFRGFRCAIVRAALIVCLASPALAENQTPTVSPVNVGSSYPYQIGLRTYDFGTAPLPTLQSFAAGTYDGKWVLLAGRTNGIHGFGSSGGQNFPPAAQNRDVWVIDPVTKQSWRRSLTADPGLSTLQLAELSSTNTQFAQIGNRLYVTGGYGQGPAGFQTFDSLSSIDLPSLAQWVMDGTGSAAGSIRTIRDSTFQVTGGAMYEMGGRMHLIFGHNFTGGYPGGTGVYTKQIRSFEVIDDGTNLAVANLTATPQVDAHRRRDLNVIPTVHKSIDGSIGAGIEALSGVFTETNGIWTVPVYINENVQTFMADPSSPATFKQAMNNYHSARLGIYSEQSDTMHAVLFGGITFSEYDYASQAFVQDAAFPFTNQITQVNIGPDGTHTQDLLGEFPIITDSTGNRLRFGAGAEFFVADGIPTYANGTIKLDELSSTDPTILGYIFGGIFSNAPHTQGVPGAVSGASNTIFEVVYTPIPEPAGLGVLTLLVVACRRGRVSR